MVAYSDVHGYIVIMSDSTRRVKRQALPADRLAQDTRRLKSRRLGSGLGVREAADKARISAGYLSDLEHGYKSAGPKALTALAAVYCCRVAKLTPYQPDEDDDEEQEVPKAA
jgi:hypothetical protein